MARSGKKVGKHWSKGTVFRTNFYSILFRYTEISNSTITNGIYRTTRNTVFTKKKNTIRILIGRAPADSYLRDWVQAISGKRKFTISNIIVLTFGSANTGGIVPCQNVHRENRTTDVRFLNDNNFKVIKKKIKSTSRGARSSLFADLFKIRFLKTSLYRARVSPSRNRFQNRITER